MNSLSWMLYLAELTGSVGALFAITGGCAALAGVAFGVAHICFAGTSPHVYSYEKSDEKLALHAATTKRLRSAALGCAKYAAPALLIATIMPSKDTMYAIAASEMGEQALKSETGSKAVKALNAWLDRQIAGSDAKKDAAK